MSNKFERVFEMRARGMTLKQIATVEGVSHQAIMYRLQKHREQLQQTLCETRICALHECEQTFEVLITSKKLYCCPVHSKRGGERNRRGLKTKTLQCRLPECTQEIVRVGESELAKQFCSKKHGGRHLNRIEIGYYDKLIEKTSCAVCEYWGPGLDQHHIVSQAEGGSDDSSNLIWLCSNHHRMLHSGLARLDGPVFVDLREEMRASEILKREDWGEA